MSIRIAIAAIILLLVVSYSSLAQNNEIKFNRVEGNNGEPLGNITGITQDSHGYMWFSGQSAGCLYRYDGNRMISFSHDSLNINSLGGTNLETVYADIMGMIWVGFFGGGLDRFNPSTGIFKHYVNSPTDPGSLGSGTISVILRDHKGRLWVGTENGLDRLDEKNGKFIHYRNEPGNPSSLSSNAVRAIYEDRKGVLWIGTGYPFDHDKPDDGGLNRMEPNGTFTRFMHDPNNPNSLINNKVRSILEDSRGVFWIGTAGDGLHTMDREKGIFERHPFNAARPDQLSRPALKPGVWYDHITFIREDGSGAIWIGTYASGINRYDPLTMKLTHYESTNGYLDKSGWMAYTSADGVLWLSATERDPNLYRVDPFYKTIKNTITGNLARCFHEDDRGFLWIGVEERGLRQYDQAKKPVHRLGYDALDSFNLLNNSVSSIFQNQKDTLWLSTTDGVYLFSKITRHFTRLGFKIAFTGRYGKEALKIIQDKQGLNWFATLGGLLQYNPENGSVKQYLPNGNDSGTISSTRVTCVMEDKSGNVWAGTWLRGGINRLNKQTGHFKHFLKGLNITCLYEDSEGTIWAGTEKGLYRFNKNVDAFSAFFDPQATTADVTINGIEEDNLKNLWITTQSEIVKLDSSRTGTFIYGKKFGIQANGLFRGGIYKTAKGEILIGNNNGFYSFFPVDLSVKIKPLPIIITDLFVNNVRLLAGNENPLVQPIEETSQIQLKHYQNNLSFSFAAIDYRSPENNKYFSRLENYDNTWREASGEKSSFFFNVPPGKYVFRVKVFNIDGIKAEKAITVILYPAWWQTWLFRIAAVIFIGAIFYGLVRWRLKQKFKLQLERSEKETQMAELNKKQPNLKCRPFVPR